MNGSYNFEKSNKEDAGMKLKYQGEKYYLGTSLAGGHDYQTSNKNTEITDVKTAGKEYAKLEFNNIRTIYTWVNTQRQQTTSLKLSLDINSKDLSAVLWCLLRSKG